MGENEKPEVLEAVLKEVVDLVMDLMADDLCFLFLFFSWLFCEICLVLFDFGVDGVLWSFAMRMQENIPIEEVFENLRCSKEGLSTEAAQQRLELFGHNKLEEKKVLFLI